MSRLLRKLTSGAMCLLGPSLACLPVVQRDAATVPIVLAQENKPSGMKLVEIWTPNAWDPVRIFNISVGKEEVKPAYWGIPGTGTPFQADENWLANLSFTLRNRTSKTITHLYLPVCFPETETKDAQMVSLPVDFRTKHAAETSTEDSESPGEVHDVPFRFALGAEIRVSLGDYTGQMRQLVEERQPLSSITRVMIAVDVVEFEDGMLAWVNRSYCIRHFDQSGTHCEILDPDYFPGILNRKSPKIDQ